MCCLWPAGCFSRSFQLDHFAALLMTISFGFGMITFYDRPLPGMGVSFYHLVIDQGTNLANALNNGIVTELWDRLNSIYFETEQPGLSIAINALEILRYAITILALAAAEIASFVVIAFGYIAARAVCVQRLDCLLIAAWDIVAGIDGGDPSSRGSVGSKSPGSTCIFSGTKRHNEGESVSGCGMAAEQPDDHTLSLSLLCGHGLGICIHRHPAGGVAEQFLHHFYICAGCSQYCRIGVPESVPPNAFGDSESGGDGTYGLAHDLLSPVWFSSIHSWAREDPVLRSFEPCMSLPDSQGLCQI
jgi:hypothetical protein